MWELLANTMSPGAGSPDGKPSYIHPLSAPHSKPSGGGRRELGYAHCRGTSAQRALVLGRAFFSTDKKLHGSLGCNSEEESGLADMNLDKPRISPSHGRLPNTPTTTFS